MKIYEGEVILGFLMIIEDVFGEVVEMKNVDCIIICMEVEKVFVELIGMIE